MKRKARKPKKPERMTKAKLRKLERRERRKALIAWSLGVRAGGECEVCKATEHLNAHHLLDRVRYPMHRTNPLNGICLCPRHHKFGAYSFHRNPIWSVIWLRINVYERYAWCKAHVNDAKGP